MQIDGILRDDIDPFVLAVFWGAWVDGLILDQMVDPQRVDPEDWANQISRLLRGGLQPQKHL